MPIPGLDADQCQRRNSLAARRDGVNAFPLRFLRADDVRLMMDSPHNRGGAGKLPKTDEEALALINQFAKTPLTLDQVWIHYLEAANTNYIGDRYMFLGDTTLKNIASDAVRGFAFMNSHRTGGLSHPAELPYGRTIAGRFESITEPGEGEEMGQTRQRTVVCCYMLRGEYPNGSQGPSTDAIHNGIDGGTIFDCSVGLYGGTAYCDVCGEDMNEYIPYDRETQTGGDWACTHWPGTCYRMTAEEQEAQVGRGVPGGVCTYTLQGANCGEVSPVYDGAVPGAGFHKILRHLKAGDMEQGDPESISQLLSAYGAFLGRGERAMLSSLFPDIALDAPTAPAGDAKPVPGAPALAQPPVQPAADRGKGGPYMKGWKDLQKKAEDFVASLRNVQMPDDEDETESENDGKRVALQPGYLAPVVRELSAEDKAKMAELERKQQEADAKLAAQQEQLDAANKRAAEAERQAQLTKNLAQINDLKARFVITPATGDKLTKLANEQPEAFQYAVDAIKDNGPVITLADATESSKPLATGGSEAVQLEKLAKAYQKEHQCSYSEAFSAVCRDNKELAEAYRAAMSEAI